MKLFVSGNTGPRRAEMFTIGNKLGHEFRLVVKTAEPLIVRCSSNSSSCSLSAICGSNKFIYVLEGCVLKVITCFVGFTNVLTVVCIQK
jgi:hypothetical protein